MKEINSVFYLVKDVCLTNFAIATNLAALAHVDSGNFEQGFQVVFVIGLFLGGEVIFEDASGKLTVVENEHGTLFVGKYSTIRHFVFEVFSDKDIESKRTIVAFWAREDLYKFSKNVLTRYTWRKCDTLRNQRVQLLKDLRRTTPGLNKKDRKNCVKAITSLWKLNDDTDEEYDLLEKKTRKKKPRGGGDR